MKAVLVECSWSAGRAKDSLFANRFHKWQRTLGKKKAAVAVCHAMLRVIYFVLKERIPYIANAGEEEVQKRRERKIRHHCKKLRELGAAPELVQQALKEFGVARPAAKSKGPRRRGALGLKAY